MSIRRFMHRIRKDEDLAEEIESHLAHEQDAHAERGLKPLRKRAAKLACVLETLTRRGSACGGIGPSPWWQMHGATCASPCVLLPEHLGSLRSRF
jgi:hypothetical protein